MSAHPFSDVEGLRVAMEMERRGGAFYRRAARILADASLRALLTDMAGEEARHLAEFEHLYERARAAGADEPYSAEMCAYLSALAADIVFPGGLAELVAEASPESILRTSIRSEEESIAFYEGMSRAARSQTARARFVDIADTERAHLAGLRARLERIQKDGDG